MGFINGSASTLRQQFVGPCEVDGLEPNILGKIFLQCKNEEASFFVIRVVPVGLFWPETFLSVFGSHRRIFF